MHALNQSGRGVWESARSAGATSGPPVSLPSRETRGRIPTKLNQVLWRATLQAPFSDRDSE